MFEMLGILMLLQGAQSMAYVLVYLLAFLIFIGVVYWLLNSFAPEPIRRWAIAIVVVLCAIGAIFLLLSFAGGGFPRFK